ncbi:MAG: hypothetical protein AAB152_10595 [Candidatus Coatesbacteria bacterium]
MKTRRRIDERNEVIYVPSEGPSTTLAAAFKTFTLRMVPESEIWKYAADAMAEFKNGKIKPVSSSAELLQPE